MNPDHAIESLVEFRHHGLRNLRDCVRADTSLVVKEFQNPVRVEQKDLT